jgi:hypothetical protein
LPHQGPSGLVNAHQEIHMSAMNGSNALDQIDISAAEVDAALSSFSASARIFSSDLPRLVDEYENKWIGVYNGKVEAVGESLEDVTNQIERKAIPISQTIVRRIDRVEKTLVL